MIMNTDQNFSCGSETVVQLYFLVLSLHYYTDQISDEFSSDKK